MYVPRIIAALVALATTLWLGLHPSLLGDVAVDVAAAVVADLLLQAARRAWKVRNEPTSGTSLDE